MRASMDTAACIWFALFPMATGNSARQKNFGSRVERVRSNGMSLATTGTVRPERAKGSLFDGHQPRVRARNLLIALRRSFPECPRILFDRRILG